jgi:hypothetical protein|tara:strand:- start:523 stop:762 length:240 start_codon:yes stop_codon:yes gene_type:complete
MPRKYIQERLNELDNVSDDIWLKKQHVEYILNKSYLVVQELAKKHFEKKKEGRDVYYSAKSVKALVEKIRIAEEALQAI